MRRLSITYKEVQFIDAGFQDPKTEVYQMPAKNLESWTDQWKQEGLQHGLERGLEQGLEQCLEQGREAARRMLLRQVRRRFDPSIADRSAPWLARIRDLGALEE